jgi:hypothetical protein
MQVDVCCPKCAGRLFADDDPFAAAPEFACLQCGWRRVVTLAEVGLLTSPDRHREPRLQAERRR